MWFIVSMNMYSLITCQVKQKEKKLTYYLLSVCIEDKSSKFDQFLKK